MYLNRSAFEADLFFCFSCTETSSFSYQNDLMANGAIFTAIIKQCPFLDRFVYIYYDERIMSKNANGYNKGRYDLI